MRSRLGHENTSRCPSLNRGRTRTLQAGLQSSDVVVLRQQINATGAPISSQATQSEAWASPLTGVMLPSQP
jgi:hypothetical protein